MFSKVSMKRSLARVTTKAMAFSLAANLAFRGVWWATSTLVSATMEMGRRAIWGKQVSEMEMQVLAQSRKINTLTEEVAKLRKVLERTDHIQKLKELKKLKGELQKLAVGEKPQENKEDDVSWMESSVSNLLELHSKRPSDFD